MIVNEQNRERDLLQGCPPSLKACPFTTEHSLGSFWIQCPDWLPYPYLPLVIYDLIPSNCPTVLIVQVYFFVLSFFEANTLLCNITFCISILLVWRPQILTQWLDAPHQNPSLPFNLFPNHFLLASWFLHTFHTLAKLSIVIGQDKRLWKK